MKGDAFDAMAYSLHALGEMARRAAHALSGFGRAFGRADSLEARRYRFGGMTEDLRRWPDQWQSFYCAGFLCEDCPTEKYDLGCTHSCHVR